MIAGLARMVRDVGLAEELAQDALVAALETWPADGVPDNPGAWLMTTAKRRAIDRLRRAKLVERKHEEIGHEPAPAPLDPRRRPRRRHRRRLAAARVHGVSPHPADRVACRAHAAPARRSDDRASAALQRRRDRARVPRPRADGGAADRPRQARARRRPRAVRGPARERARRAAGVGARGSLPGLQRGLRGDRRRRLAAPGAVRGRAAARPHPARARARRARGARARGADGDPGVAVRRAHRPRRRADLAAGSEPRALGSAG